MSTINILAVDDRTENLNAIKAVLSDMAVNLHFASSGQEALTKMLAIEFAVVLLDDQMPEMDSYETAELMRCYEKTKHTPIIFVTAINTDQKHSVKKYASGAADYIFKPIQPDILRSKINMLSELYRHKIALKKNVAALQKANRQLLKHQKLKIEIERLKTLLQMAGAASHELSHPLMILSSGIELLRSTPNDPECLEKHLKTMKDAEQRIETVIQKIHAIQRDHVKWHERQHTAIDIHRKLDILYVGDDPAYFRHISEQLAATNFEFKNAPDMATALTQLQRNIYQLIIVDHNLPYGDGLGFIKQMKSANIDIPVIMLTRPGDEMIASQMIQTGVFEYLPKADFNRKILIDAIQNALEKDALKKEAELIQQELAEMAFKDELTGLFNRRYITSALEQEIAIAERYKTALSLCIIDIDHFKHIDDTYGHGAGDYVLTEMTKSLLDCTRKSDRAGRYSGEEFLLILPHTTLQSAHIVCERFRQKMADHYITFNDNQIHITVSIGVSEYGKAGAVSMEALLEKAGQALYTAKEAGQNQTFLWNSPQ